MSIVLPLFGVAARGDVKLEMACIGYSVLGNTEVRCDTGFSIDTFYVKQMSPLLPLLPLLGVLSGVGLKASLRLLPLVIPYSGTLRYTT